MSLAWIQSLNVDLRIQISGATTWFTLVNDEATEGWYDGVEWYEQANFLVGYKEFSMRWCAYPSCGNVLYRPAALSSQPASQPASWTLNGARSEARGHSANGDCNDVIVAATSSNIHCHGSNNIHLDSRDNNSKVQSLSWRHLRSTKGGRARQGRIWRRVVPPLISPTQRKKALAVWLPTIPNSWLDEQGAVPKYHHRDRLAPQDQLITPTSA